MCRTRSRRPNPGGGASRSARPDQLVLAVALDQVGVDRGGEARVVELDADELAPVALAGAQPACADLDLPYEDAVVGLRFAALFGRRDRDLGLEAHGLDGAAEAGVALGEGADGCHDSESPFVDLGRAHRGLDGSGRAGRA